MNSLPFLNPGDCVAIVTPASRCAFQHITDLIELLTSWQLKCVVDPNLFGDDLLCANTDEQRFKSLKNALENSDVKGIICARGGYGSMRLIPELNQITFPETPKIFVGMSDITALHLYFEQQKKWPTIHGALAKDKFSPDSITTLKALLFGTKEKIILTGLPLNSAAQRKHSIRTSITGGNLCLVQTSIGTIWQIDGRNKIVFLEEINERGYRLDRMLEHLRQADVFEDTAAILLGDFIGGTEPDNSSLVQEVLHRFSQQFNFPVVQINGIGHGYINFPLPFGIPVDLELGQHIELTYGLS